MSACVASLKDRIFIQFNNKLAFIAIRERLVGPVAIHGRFLGPVAIHGRLLGPVAIRVEL